MGAERALDRALEEKLRIVQELVPGKQITIAHIIANPSKALAEKLSLPSGGNHGAIGIVTMSPAEAAIIAADIALKAAGVALGVVDTATGTLIFTGSVSEVEAALKDIMAFAGGKMDFSVCEITRT